MSCCKLKCHEEGYYVNSIPLHLIFSFQYRSHLPVAIKTLILPGFLMFSYVIAASRGFIHYFQIDFKLIDWPASLNTRPISA